jgi:ankyrin repeat protein
LIILNYESGMKNNLLYLLMPSLLPVMLQGGEATPAGSVSPTFGSLSSISGAVSNGASVERLHNALQELYRSSQSGSSSVESSSEAFDLLGKKRVRSLRSLSQDRFLDIGSSEHGYSSGDEVSVGSFSDDSSGLVNGSKLLDLEEVLDLKDNGCDLTRDEDLPYESWFNAPSCMSVNDEKKRQIITEAKQLLSSAQSGNSKDLTKLIKLLREHPNLSRWYDENGNSLASHLANLTCNEQAATVDQEFLNQIITRKQRKNSHNPVFSKLREIAACIKKDASELSSFEPRFIPWQMQCIKDQAEKKFFEKPDNKLSDRKCKAATEFVAAIERNDVDQVDKLMAANPKLPSYCDATRNFPMQYAAKFNRAHLIAKFHANGVHPDHSYDGMLTPLQLAVVNGNIEAVSTLVAIGANKNKGIYRGNQILVPTPTAYMTARTLAAVLARGNQPNAKKICLFLEQNQ